MDINNNISEFDIFDNDMELLINEFCEKYNIQDMSKETQQRWNACMTFVYNNIFKDTTLLKYNPNINNKYDSSKLSKILELYIYYCEVFSKVITITGYIRLTGVSRDIIERWRKESSCDGFGISKKLDIEGRESLLDKLVDDNHFLGINQRGRIEHGFDGEIANSTRNAIDSVQALPSFQESDTKQLCVNDTQLTPSDNENT